MQDTSRSEFCLQIDGVTFTVGVHPAEKAKQTTEEFLKALILKESLAFESDAA